MNRVRWLSARWPISMRTLAAKMKDNRFTPDSFDGFVIERIRDNSIEAHFIEKINCSEITTDPFGKEEVLDRVVYRNVNFTLFSEFPHVEIKGSPRSTKEFVSKLLELCNFSLTITSISVDLMDWVEALQKILGQALFVDSLQLSGLVLEEGVTAKVLLKGNRDVREAVTHLSPNKKCNLDKLQVKMKIGNKYIRFHLSNAGIASIQKSCFEDFLPVLRASLPPINHQIATINEGAV